MACLVTDNLEKNRESGIIKTFDKIVLQLKKFFGRIK